MDAGHTQLNREHVNALWEKASNKHWEFGRLISLWEHDISVPAELRPPKNSKGQLVRFDYVDLIGRRTARVAAFRSEAVA